jgi:hypothetical protein
MIKPKAMVGLVTILLLPSLCFGGFRCKPDAIVEEGDTKSEVSLLCGTPMTVDREGKVKINGNKVLIERWTYNPGKGKFYVILDFRNGVLTKISHGPRVR